MTLRPLIAIAPSRELIYHDRFWTYFFERRHATSGMRCDDLLLLASFVNQIRELFENLADEAGLAWLDQLENECF